MKTRVSLLTLCLVGLIGLSGCGSGGNGGGSGTGRAFAINALADASATPVDILVNNRLPFNNVGYGQVVGSASVDAGSMPVTVRNTSNGSTIVPAQNVSITRNVDQLLIVGGLVGGSGATAAQITNLGRVDLSDSSIPTSADARVYFVNAVPLTPTGGVNFSYAQSGPSTSPVEAQGVPFRQLTNQILVLNGGYTFTAAVGGEMVNSPAIQLDGRGVYLVLLTGNPASSGQTPGLSLQVVRLD
jgi:hypothetical protein